MKVLSGSLMLLIVSRMHKLVCYETIRTNWGRVSVRMRLCVCLSSVFYMHTTSF